ncbi:hypothetical protein B0H14DRAFT_2650887 [Mycena olivaceomarginata]|nr:hypothetical protein B0H14DRAFT_2650887 [Mycena olivaceomarginata]
MTPSTIFAPSALPPPAKAYMRAKPRYARLILTKHNICAQKQRRHRREVDICAPKDQRKPQQRADTPTESQKSKARCIYAPKSQKKGGEVNMRFKWEPRTGRDNGPENGRNMHQKSTIYARERLSPALTPALAHLPPAPAPKSQKKTSKRKSKVEGRVHARKPGYMRPKQRRKALPLKAPPESTIYRRQTPIYAPSLSPAGPVAGSPQPARRACPPPPPLPRPLPLPPPLAKSNR